jgi:DNA-binding transcriptional MerR regulator
MIAARVPDDVLSIRDVANRFGLTHRTLRFWEGKQLIRPLRRNDRRFYPAHVVADLERIVPWSRAGISLKDIRSLLRMAATGADTTAHVDALLADLRREAVERIAAIDAIQPATGAADSVRTNP